MTGNETDQEWELAAAKAWLGEMIIIANRAAAPDPKVVQFIHAVRGMQRLLDAAGDHLSLDQIGALMAMMGRPETPSL